MLKHLLSACILASIVFVSCKKAEEDPDNANAITGTYKMTVYNTKTGGNNSNPAPGNNMVITKVDKNTVKVVMDYADPSATDLVFDKMAIKKNGSVYNLSQNFSNATSTGNVNGSTFTLDMTYTSGPDNGNWVHVVSVK